MTDLDSVYVSQVIQTNLALTSCWLIYDNISETPIQSRANAFWIINVFILYKIAIISDWYTLTLPVSEEFLRHNNPVYIWSIAEKALILNARNSVLLPLTVLLNMSRKTTLNRI